MSEHLTERQVLECVTGAAGMPRHVEECARCAAEVNRLSGAVRGFAAAVHEAPVPAAPRLDWAEATRRRAGWAPGWRLATAVLILLLAAIPLLFRVHLPRRSDFAFVHQQQLERERADAALLDEVDAAVSRPVPQTVEPLVQLVAWGTNTNSGVTE